LDGNKKLRNALLGVKGIGKSLSNGIAIASGLDGNALLGSLTEEQIKNLEEVINDPGKYGIPYHMLNRRFDPSTGQHMHLVSSKLTFANRSDIDFMKKIKCYKGVRHELGLPVRGQRTRVSFRKGGIVGVAKIRLKPGAAPAGKEALPGEKAPTAAKEGKPEAKPSAPAKTEAKKEEKKPAK
jgi:small subunit ribosomal protein S13